jgi:hypothetical protein
MQNSASLSVETLFEARVEELDRREAAVLEREVKMDEAERYRKEMDRLNLYSLAMAVMDGEISFNLACDYMFEDMCTTLDEVEEQMVWKMCYDMSRSMNVDQTITLDTAVERVYTKQESKTISRQDITDRITKDLKPATDV